MMLDPTGEQLEFKAEVRRFLERSSPVPVTRAVIDGGSTHDPKVWDGLARLGALGLLVPAEYGGSGAGIVEAAFVGEELGRVVAAAPYLSSAVLAARTLTLLGDEAVRARYLPGIADGTTVATVALLDGAGRWSPSEVGVRAERDGDGWRLVGRVPFVTDAAAADLVLVVARTEAGLGVFAVTPAAAGVGIGALDCLDRTQPLHRLDLDRVAAVRVGVGADATAALDQVVLEGLAWLTCAQVGAAERCLELSADYARVRVQFGRVIGSYQAIKHRCADMFIRVQSARSAAYHLVETLRIGAPGPDIAASLAKAYCSEAATACAGDTIQIHGGIGFTWEHDAHLYFKRATASAHLFGDPAHHRALLACELRSDGRLL